MKSILFHVQVYMAGAAAGAAAELGKMGAGDGYLCCPPGQAYIVTDEAPAPPSDRCEEGGAGPGRACLPVPSTQLPHWYGPTPGPPPGGEKFDCPPRHALLPVDFLFGESEVSPSFGGGHLQVTTAVLLTILVAMSAAGPNRE